jgi:hypothetical protein
MTRVTAFGRFLWEFIVGDDWRIAAGVAISLGVTALVAGAGAIAWWIVPVAVMLLLAFSVWRVGRQ